MKNVGSCPKRIELLHKICIGSFVNRVANTICCINRFVLDWPRPTCKYALTFNSHASTFFGSSLALQLTHVPYRTTTFIISHRQLADVPYRPFIFCQRGPTVRTSDKATFLRLWKFLSPAPDNKTNKTAVIRE